MSSKKKIAVVAIGGNSLIKDEKNKTVKAQYEAAGETCRHIAKMIQHGWSIVIVHGNGPQVGFVLRRSELAAKELHEIPLDVCVADTQGALGYALQQNLYNALQEMGVSKQLLTIITQVEVDADDPAFKKPSKPIGSFMNKTTALQRREDGWAVADDAGRGWRRVVASPFPKHIVEAPAIKEMVERDIVVIAAGGGGIPVVIDSRGNLKGVPAVIDKDHAAAFLAKYIKADLFVISTAVEKVVLNFGKPNATPIDHITLTEAKQYLQEGIHFAKGSMAPKIEAAINFIEAGGTHVIITNPENIESALNGKSGTHITPTGTEYLLGG